MMAQRKRFGQPQTSTTVSLTAPIGGWNARDSLALMAPQDAVTLQNYWPTTTDVMFRKGYTNFANGFLNQVESIFWYSSGTANKQFGVEGGNIWNSTAGGAIGGGSPDVSGLKNSRFQYINITTPGGSFLMAVNAADKLQGYDGTSWYVDGDGGHDISGFDTATAAHINLHQSRVWFVESGTLVAWYLDVNSIAGAATSFDLSSIARKGGFLMAMYSWTIDAGYGMDDLAVWVTSNGEVIIYRGTDPSSASTWSLVGVFQIGSPIGRRCGLKFGGDLIIITQDGVVPMAQGLQSSRLDPRVNLTDKIQQAISNAATSYSGHFGWQLLYYAKANMLITNIPVAEGSSQQQYCMNTISKAWAQFMNVNANCWELFNDEPYFGGNGFIGRFWNGFSDFPADVAQPINTFGLQAFNYFKMPGAQKHFRMMRPILNTDGVPAVGAAVNVDFDQNDNTTPVIFSPILYARWDQAIWDVSMWAGILNIQKNWQGATGLGYCAAPQIKGSASGIETHWMATDLVMERGTTL